MEFSRGCPRSNRPADRALELIPPRTGALTSVSQITHLISKFEVERSRVASHKESCSDVPLTLPHDATVRAWRRTVWTAIAATSLESLSRNGKLVSTKCAHRKRSVAHGSAPKGTCNYAGIRNGLAPSGRFSNSIR
jgi:hypothetical protein